MNPGIQDLANKGLCTECKQPINKTDFKTDKEKKEFEISGWCAHCQEIIFKTPKEE
jgi:hypothetical protein